MNPTKPSSDAEDIVRAHRELEAISSSVNPFIKTDKAEMTMEHYDVGQVYRAAKIISYSSDAAGIIMLDSLRDNGIISTFLESEILSEIAKFDEGDDIIRPITEEELDELVMTLEKLTEKEISLQEVTNIIRTVEHNEVK